MRKIGSILLLFVALVACNKTKDNTYKVTVNVEGVEDGKKVYLQKPVDGQRPEVLDTLEVKEGSFEFSGETEGPEMHYLYFEGIRGVLPIILEEGNISVTAYKDSLNFSKIEGTPSNEDFTAFIQSSRNIRKKMMDIQKQGMEAQQKGDTVTLNTLKETFEEVQQEAKDYEQDFVANNKDSYISLLVIQQMMRTKSKTPEEVNTLFKGLSEDIRNTEMGKSIAKELGDIDKLAIGAIAPDFSAPTPDGETISLKESLGKVTILDFWAAWCKPCRAENPNLVALYKEYHDKGLNVVGVSLDRKAEDWKKAIEEDQLPWKHMSNLKFWQDPIAQLYNIRSIPATYILDEDGKIIAKDLRGEALNEKIASLLQ
ncbi:TlpA disulfide reductase family protein [Galbibacter pacificus]|uniref:TlpA disulfide reductase family protein n=1 Tax=Galbibacter pacificus TaxID=2996052 RepID=A0ABT6FQE8_9FLAO|nr:TlpA disulfide reductase family protein [Galbibacter pacificus]MDG3582079.1 TlpA disulfide reductase family protein [Galbibacter pacificus]MDG3585445.1 TlpA disulfide reductase family protein [Galbibacter pacificus]